MLLMPGVELFTEGHRMTYSFNLMTLICFIVFPAYGGEPKWFLLSRENGCIGLELLAKHEKLPKIPTTPEEFSEMMRERGYRVTLSLPEGFPSEFSGKVVMVKVRENMSPVFVREDFCRQVNK